MGALDYHEGNALRLGLSYAPRLLLQGLALIVVALLALPVGRRRRYDPVSA